jgi:hypothetical protein
VDVKLVRFGSMNYVDARPASNYKKGWDNPVE